MKREIKFRAWDGKRMYEWKESGLTENEGQFEFNSYERQVRDDGGVTLSCYVKYWDDKDIIKTQFINSKDAIENDIYEGDILKAPSGELFEVKWHDEEMRWAMFSKDTWYNMNMGLHEVVGNIFNTQAGGV